MEESLEEEKDLSTTLFPPAPTGRKLCIRHQRMADEGTNLKLQHSLDLLPDEERSAIAQIWASFSASSHARRDLILRGILTMCCFTELSLLSDQLRDIIRIDPFTLFPSEVSLRVLSYLDATTLTKTAQVNRNWNRLSNDDILWKTMCEQHIERKCHKCGWGLPFLKAKKNWPPGIAGRPTIAARPSSFAQSKRTIDELDRDVYPSESPSKRHKSTSPEPSPVSPIDSPALSGFLSPCPMPATAPTCVTRPWKDVYHERHQVECNWRKGQYVVSTLQGHTEGVMCLQYSEDLHTPSFPVLITGSYDRTARVWNLETGKEIRTLRGHSRAIRALQFDEVKLITGSMDHTLKVWNWRNGQCVRTLEGHTEGVVCLQFDGNVLASGSVDTTVKVWNLRTGECFTLRGHRDWVNAVTIWDSKAGSSDHVSELTGSHQLPDIDAGKMLFSASDDGVIRLWDLNLRQCVRQYHGHVGQVQSIKLLLLDEGCEEPDSAAEPREPDYSEIVGQFQSSVGDGSEETEEPVQPALGAIQPFNHPYTQLPSGLPGFAPVSVSIPTVPPANHPGYDSPAFHPSATYEPHDHERAANRKLPVQKRTGPVPMLISGSLDNTIKVWDVESGRCTKTLFGHIEGVWAVDSDRLRLVSASHDRTIKVWVREQGRCITTLVGHHGAVTCIALGDDKIISGSDDGTVKIWSFARDAKPIPASSSPTPAA
ncbi:WD40 repeat-like protein [Dacryopinax primogenitus]|uniref:WD40 repeat-like protein n=1 Tax=Dacryopinax primogenitus (strain DJM 731) TaxID=1858805 RepID=M5G5Q7_DACPD|nr:WD40 repeat-like protein [Dacryopinax primogenitus]EJU05596.1 WD40 repeat-like protein [Dacryopinax primogenitus]